MKRILLLLFGYLLLHNLGYSQSVTISPVTTNFIETKGTQNFHRIIKTSPSQNSGLVFYQDADNYGGLYLRGSENRYNLTSSYSIPGLVYDRASNNVGVGTFAPNSKLQVTGSYAGIAAIAPFQIQASSTFSGMDFTNSINANHFTILGSTNSTTSDENYLLFNSSHSGNAMIIRGDGDIGMGIDGPQYPLHASGTLESSSSTTGSFAIGLNSTNHMNFDPNEIDSYVGTAGTRMYLNYNAQEPVHVRERLEVGTTGGLGKAVIYYDSNTGDPQLNLYENSTTDGPRVKFRNTGSSNYWDLYGKPSTTASGADFNIFYSQTGNIATFQGNGRVGIGTTNPSTIFEVSDSGSPFIRISDVSGGSAVGIEFFRSGVGSRDWRQQNSGGDLEFRVSNDDLATSVIEYEMTETSFQPGGDNLNDLGSSIRRWDDVYATNGTIQTSDRREKENIKSLNYGLAEVLKLSPVRYTWIDKPEKGQKVGLIAQEVAVLVPEVVNGLTKDGKIGEERLGMNYGELVPVLINAIKEQQAMIAKLSGDVIVLKSELASLEDSKSIKITNTDK